MKHGIARLTLDHADISFVFREDSVGDRGVIQQIFESRDYDISHWQQGRRLREYHEAQAQLRPSLIVDAGANIGASVVYFLNSFSNSFVFAIEPDVMNWHLLEINTASYPNRFSFCGAVSNADGELLLIDPGRSDWGFMTADAAASADDTGKRVRSISPASILSHPSTANTTPLIFKIDIEGGESALFDGDIAWLDQFALVIIELHDWMLPFSGASKSFLKAVAQFDFDFVHRGENIFLFNRRILAGGTA